MMSLMSRHSDRSVSVMRTDSNVDSSSLVHGIRTYCYCLFSYAKTVHVPGQKRLLLRLLLLSLLLLPLFFHCTLATLLLTFFWHVMMRSID